MNFRFIFKSHKYLYYRPLWAFMYGGCMLSLNLHGFTPRPPNSPETFSWS